MISVSMFEAKTNLSKYVASVVDKKEPFVVILKNGKPVAQIVPYDNGGENRIGAGIGIIPPLNDADGFNDLDVSDDFFGDGGIM